jgi:outer membrane protein assembly factor BamA
MPAALTVFCAACALCAVTTPARAVNMSTMPDVKISDARMVEMPDFRFILPNSSIELSVHQQVSSTTIDIASRYDILDSFFHIGLDVRYDFTRFFTGGRVDDTINFEQNYGPKTYFQRTHSVTPYVGYKLGRFTSIKTGIAIGNTLTASVDKSLQLDKGNNIVESAGITYTTIDALNPIANGTRLEATVYGSFRGVGSDYEYTNGEAEIKNTHLQLHNYLETDIKYFFPLKTVLKPISEVYFAGGYELLRGYSYREFFGDTLMYAKFNYHIPIVANVKEEPDSFSWHILTLDFAYEAARVDSAADFGKAFNPKSSVSFGLGWNMIFLKHINLKFDTFSGKALEPRAPVLYFILNAYTYFSA